MENASKALLMAAGVLIGILILALMTTLLLSSRSLSMSYEETKQSEAIQQFNVNFTKYVGHDLTIHQVVTICNFAENNNVHNVTVINGKESKKIVDDVKSYDEYNIKTYKLTINSYTNEGYVDKITFSG